MIRSARSDSKESETPTESDKFDRGLGKVVSDAWLAVMAESSPAEQAPAVSRACLAPSRNPLSARHSADADSSSSGDDDGVPPPKRRRLGSAVADAPVREQPATIPRVTIGRGTIDIDTRTIIPSLQTNWTEQGHARVTITFPFTNPRCGTALGRQIAAATQVTLAQAGVAMEVFERSFNAKTALAAAVAPAAAVPTPPPPPPAAGPMSAAVAGPVIDLSGVTPEILLEILSSAWSYVELYNARQVSKEWAIIARNRTVGERVAWRSFRRGDLEMLAGGLWTQVQEKMFCPVCPVRKCRTHHILHRYDVKTLLLPASDAAMAIRVAGFVRAYSHLAFVLLLCNDSAVYSQLCDLLRASVDSRILQTKKTIPPNANIFRAKAPKRYCIYWTCLLQLLKLERPTADVDGGQQLTWQRVLGAEKFDFPRTPAVA